MQAIEEHSSEHVGFRQFCRAANTCLQLQQAARLQSQAGGAAACIICLHQS